MIGITNAGGGKDRLNLRVFGGTTAPSNPKGNDIWVKTSIAIPNNSVFINEVVSNFWTGAANGGIYIKFESSNSSTKATTGANIFTYRSGSNLQEFNVIFLGCMQIMNGVWANVEAYIYHNGWHQFSSVWNGELFYQGNQYTEHTGGWTGMVRNPNVSTNVADPANPNLFSDANADPVATAWFRTVNKVDMTNYRTLKWTGWGFGSNSGGNYAAHCTVHNNPSTDNGVISDKTFQAEGTYSMDISGISGAHYITFRAWGSRGQRISISKVWLE